MSLLKRVDLARADSGHRIGWPSLVGILLIPLIVAAGFLYATWDSSSRLDTVKAAIVNQDKPVTINKQLVPLGRQLAGGLVTSGGATAKATKASQNTADQNYDWVLSDAADAAAGLASGEYAAVVTIPENFSAAATSYSKDADQAEQATIDVQVSSSTSIVDPALSRAIVAAAVTSLNSQLTTTYLDNVYVGFNTLNKQFSTVADAAKKLSQGATSLSDGVAATDRGAGQLADGLGQLDIGGGQLATGATTYTNGVTSASRGLTQLATGTKELPAQVRQLSDGVAGISTGAAKLSTGAGQLAEGADQLDAGVPKLASGAKQLASAADQVAGGVDQTAAGAKQLAPAATGVNQGLEGYRTAMAALPSTITCAQGQITDPAQCAAFEAGVKAASAAAVQGLTTPVAPNAPTLIGLAGSVDTGASGLSIGLNGDGTAKNPGLATATRGIATGAQGISDGLNGTPGQPGLASGVKGVASGADQLASGASELAAGATKLATGADTFADGIPQLSQGISSAATGVGKLSTAGTQLAASVGTYTDGVGQSATGARSLADGIGKLSTGATGLAKGTAQLSDGLAKGADAVPTYSQAERDNLATVVATPVDAPAPADAGIFSDVSASAFLLAIALWIGALTTFLVLGTGVKQAWSSTSPSWAIALRRLLPAAVIGVVQALALGGLVSALLDLSAVRTAGVLGLAAMTSVTFVAINYALVGLFGGVGRFLSVLVIVVSAAGALLSAVPAFFTTVRPVLPLTPALDGIKAVAGDGAGAGLAFAGLLAWLVLALLASVLAVVRHRQVRPDRVLEAVRA
ncbi:MAG: YhgE/Pip family protein [Propionibacteriaceae bacterium]